MVCEQPWVDLNPRPSAQKATTLTTAPRRPHTGLIMKTRISIVFRVFPPERNFRWDNHLCFGYHNTLRSLIKAHIKTVAMEKFQKVCPIMVINTKPTDLFHVSQSIIRILRHRNPLRYFVIVSNYIFSSFKGFALCYCSSTDFDTSAVLASN